jgi:uncharacterized delta-60 repeat protein
LIVNPGKRIYGVCGATAAVLLLVLCLAAPASAETMVLQPDGKIVVVGWTWPESGSLARLNADGSLDTSFGAGGFVTDHRLPGFRALGLGPDGRIVGAAVGGFQLARYLPNGSPDTAFAGGGVGGTSEPDQIRFIYGRYGPAAVIVQPDGGIVVAGTREVNGGGASDGWVKRYDGSGRLAEVVGHVPLPGGPATDSGLTDLAQAPDGSFAGVGWFYPGSPAESDPLLARFVPGSGSAYDAGFGGGAGLLRPTFQSRQRFHTRLEAIAVSGGKFYVAGGTAGTFLVARYNPDGTRDGSFGEGGFAAPPISGPGDAASQTAFEPASTWANDVAIAGDGAVLLGGGTSQWGVWTFSKAGTFCSECPQPMLAKFDAGGHLDPGFGSGGLLRLAKPDGSTFVGEVEQVATLADGKYLVKGSGPVVGFGRQPWVARLNADGSYDRGFGGEGLTVPHFPCTDQPAAEQRAAGCVGSAKVRLRTHGLRGGRPSLSLRVRANVSWAPIRELGLTLPRGMRFTKAVKSKLRVVGAGAGAEVHVIAANRKHGPGLSLQKVSDAPVVKVVLRRGALRWVHRRPARHRKLALRIGIGFSDLVAAPEYGGNQTITLRAG